MVSGSDALFQPGRCHAQNHSLCSSHSLAPPDSCAARPASLGSCHAVGTPAGKGRGGFCSQLTAHRPASEGALFSVRDFTAVPGLMASVPSAHLPGAPCRTAACTVTRRRGARRCHVRPAVRGVRSYTSVLRPKEFVFCKTMREEKGCKGFRIAPWVFVQILVNSYVPHQKNSAA